MRVIAESELGELILTGYHRKYQDVARNPVLMKGLKRAVRIMESVDSSDVLARYSFLHYEKLRYGWSGYSSVRLSNSFVHRLLFREEEDQITLHLIEIDDKHYGNKK